MNSSYPNPAARAVRTSSAKGARRFSRIGQAKLFPAVAAALPGSMNDAAMVRCIAVEAMKACPLSRAQIADEMGRLTGLQITERMLNAFAADSREDHRFPLELVRAFCGVTGDDRLLTACAEAAGLHVIDDAGWELLELGREYLKQKRAGAEIARIERKLQEVSLG